MANKYQYTPLNQSRREVRLLLIQPGKFDDPLSCKIMIKSLDDQPQYNALSYTWGSPTPVQEITVNESSFEVGPNLESGLRHLRSEDAEFCLWADAICINQDDLEEKSWQVMMMADVYRGAERVRVWLGAPLNDNQETQIPVQDTELSSPIDNKPKIEASDIAWANCDMWKLVDLLSGDAPCPQFNADIIWDEADPELGKLCRIAEESAEHPAAIQAWDELRKVFEHPYWTRAWIQQELAIPSGEKAIVHYGKQNRSLLQFWRTCLVAMKTCQNTEQARTKKGYTSLAGLVIAGRKFFGVCSMYFPAKKVDNEKRVWSIMNAQHECYCTNLLDKVYGLLGIIEPWTQGALKVDYTLSANDVYCEAFASLVEYWQSLGIFSKMHRVPGHLRDKSLPTWCPDLNYSISFRELKYHDTDHPTMPLTFWPCGKQLTAAGDSKAICRFSKGYKILSAQGLLVSKIKDLCALDLDIRSIPGISKGIKAFKSMVLRNAQDLSHRSEQTTTDCGSEQVIMDALWRTLCTDRPRPVLDANRFHDSPPPSYEYAFHLLSEIDLTKDFTSLYLITEKFPQEYKIPTGLSQTEAVRWFMDFTFDFYDATRYALKYRRFCISSEAGFCLVPDDAMVGDLLCVLFGCEVPVVLRQVGDHYVYIGEAYMHGWMYGEAMELFEKGNLKQETFEIH